MSLLVIFLLSVSVSALSPSPEIECCYSIGSWEAQGEEMEKECSEFNLTEEKCEPLIAGWDKSVKWWYEQQGKGYDDEQNVLINKILGAAAVIIFALILYYFLTREKKVTKKKRK